MMLFRKIWEGWKKIAHRIGNFQARLLLGLFYFVILGPVALAVNLKKDVLSVRPGTTKGWKDRETDETPAMDRALRQF